MKHGRKFQRIHGPLLRLCGTTKVFGLSERQIVEWYRRFADLRPRQRIYLEEKS